jgi:hypothetical protein
MYTFTVEAITKTKCWINGIQACLEYPTPDLFRRRMYSISLRGWVGSLVEEVDDICLSWLGIRVVPAQIVLRSDLLKKYPERKYILGFQLDIVPLVFGRDEPLKIILTTKGGRSSPLFEISLRFDEGKVRKGVVGSKPPAFTPIVSSGRCGSTFLAQVLLRSKAIGGCNEYPYEAHTASQLSMKWFSELQPTYYQTTGSSQSPDQGLSAIYSVLNQSAGDMQPIEAMTVLSEQARRQTCDHITQLYRIIAPQKSPSVILEKVDWAAGLSFYLSREVFADFRPIFLIRDPRDLILSIRSFNEKRGNYWFHEADALNLEVQVLWLAASLRHVAWYYDRIDASKILVKYEDLVRNPPEVFHQIFSFLGIDHSAKEIAKFLNESAPYDKHLTSSSPETSIGRWKQELTDSQKEMVNWVLHPFIGRFGY